MSGPPCPGLPPLHSTPLHSAPHHPAAYSVRTGGRGGGAHRRAEQRAGHRQPDLSARHPGRLRHRNGLAAGRLCDDQHVGEPAAGEVSPAVRAAPVHRNLPGAVRAHRLRAPVRAHPELGDQRARRAWLGGRRAQLVGPVLRDPGISTEIPAQGRGAGPGYDPAGVAAGAGGFHRPAGIWRVARPVPVRVRAGGVCAGLCAGAQVTAGRPVSRVRAAGFSHL